METRCSQGNPAGEGLSKTDLASSQVLQSTPICSQTVPLMELGLTSDKSSGSESQEDISVSATPKRRRKRCYSATKAKNRAAMKRRREDASIVLLRTRKT